MSDTRRAPIVNRSNVFQSVAFAFCVLTGLAMIVNTQTAGEGVWSWYSSFFRSGKHLYADMHLALQPLYVLETSAFIAVLGKGWLVSKIPAALHLVAYCLGLLLLVRQSTLSDARKAMLFASAFFISVSSVSYRFDDYHVLADCFVVYSLVALLSLRTSSNVYRTLGLAALLGVLSGLTMTTRLNDGAALFAGVFLAIVCLAPLKKLLSLLLFSLATGFTQLVVVFLTGDSLRDYATNSIFKAAAIKGDGGSVLAQPLRLPWNTMQWLIDGAPIWVCFYAFVAAIVLTFMLLRPLRRKRGWWEFGVAVFGAVLVTVIVYRMGLFVENASLSSLAGLVVVLAYGLGIWVAARFVIWLFDPKHANGWDKREILLLIPLGQMASGSMSTGGTHYCLFAPIGVFIVLLAICSPIHLKGERVRDILIALSALLITCTVLNKLGNPYHWHTYREKPMFADRVWYQHPDYGPMIIDNDLLQMIQPVCQAIQGSGSENELLSLPFPGGNYFCSIPPWQGYVQTFFDTTSKQTIQRLIDELQHAPPKWILYQRQLTTLRLHEVVYNQGNPLKHRDLDLLIEQKVGEGTWHVVYTSDYGTRQQWGELWDSQWILIQTR